MARGLLRLVWQVPYSAFIWGAGFGVMVASSLVSLVAYPFRTPAQQSLWSARAFAKVLHLTRGAFTIRYDPGFDRDHTSVFCFNHVNLLDAHVACHTIPQPFVGLMLSWHFKVPGYGWMMRATHGIAVYPRSQGRTEKLAESARDRVAKGLSILTFPEGHRTRDGAVRPFKRGVFFMARSAGVPVVPVGVRGMYEINHKGTMLFTPGDVAIYVGPQIETEGLTTDGVTQLAKAAHAAVANFVEGRDDGESMSALAGWTPE